ncbi:hypothetical protein ACFLZK_00575 [Patescibacteria group bacterium]
MRDFTLSKYENLLVALNKRGVQIYGVKCWVEQKPDRGVLIRHDVDRKPINALKVAELELKHNTFTTYYFRSKKNSFKPEIIKEIAEMGHEIGYHYENLSDCKGSYRRAINDFEKNLNILREVTEINTIAMHGKPLSQYKNDSLWNKYNYKKYGILAESFNTIDYTDTYYFTDTGRVWQNNKNNLRDKVNTTLSADINSTEELIKFIDKEMKVAVVVHPERWNDDIIGWVYSYIFDVFANTTKKFLEGIRK